MEFLSFCPCEEPEGRRSNPAAIRQPIIFLRKLLGDYLRLVSMLRYARNDTITGLVSLRGAGFTRRRGNPAAIRQLIICL